MRMLLAAVLMLAAVLVLTGARAEEASTAPAAGAAAPADTAQTPGAPANPAMTGPRIQVSTSMGDIVVQLDAVRAPKSTANVLRYVREKHYNGTAIYRVVKGFVIQMGSWDANVKPRPVHAPVAFEGGNGLSNLRGTVALAHGDDPNSAVADFFINLSDNTALDHVDGDPQKIGYAVIGQVVSGMDVVDAIAQVPVGDHGPMKGEAPVTPIIIKKISILPEPK